MNKIKAIYPGSFDPITNGHVDIIRRSVSIFNELTVVVAKSPKKNFLFTPAERKSMIEELFKETPGVKVEIHEGLLIDYAKQSSAQVIVRGLRAVTDFEYEFQLAGMNRRLAPEIETIFLTPAEHLTYISSSLIREIAALGGDVSEFVHPAVAAAIRI